MFHGDLTLKRNLLMLSPFTETSLFLCLSTCLCHCQLTTKGRTGQINRSPPGSTLDYTTLVYTSTETASRPPSPTSSVGQPSAPAPQQAVHPLSKSQQFNQWLAKYQGISPATTYFKEYVYANNDYQGNTVFPTKTSRNWYSEIKSSFYHKVA